jgi:hypothetical protein
MQPYVETWLLKQCLGQLGSRVGPSAMRPRRDPGGAHADKGHVRTGGEASPEIGLSGTPIMTFLSYTCEKVSHPDFL